MTGLPSCPLTSGCNTSQSTWVLSLSFSLLSSSLVSISNPLHWSSTVQASSAFVDISWGRSMCYWANISFVSINFISLNWCISYASHCSIAPSNTTMGFRWLHKYLITYIKPLAKLPLTILLYRKLLLFSWQPWVLTIHYLSWHYSIRLGRVFIPEGLFLHSRTWTCNHSLHRVV